MKKFRLWQALGEVDDALTEAADPHRQSPKRPLWIQWMPVAAAAAVALTCVGLWQGGVFRPATETKPGPGTTQSTAQSATAQTEAGAQTTGAAPATTTAAHKGTTVASHKGTTVTSHKGPTGAVLNTTTRWPQIMVDVSQEQERQEEAIEIIPRWEEKTICEKFPEADFSENRYSGGKPLAAKHVGKALGQATLHGHDIYTETDYTVGATLYAIKGVATHCAVAVQFEKQAAYYVYTNTWYAPDTLQDFIDDLRLREHLTVGTAYGATNVIRNGVWSEVKFTGLTETAVFDILFADASVKNVKDFDRLWFEDTSDPLWFEEVMSVSVNVPLLGIHNVSLAVTEGGYLTTNILGTQKAFFIGTERVQRFVDHVEQHCSGIECIYYTAGEVESNATTGDGTDATVTVTSQAYRPE